MIAILCTWNYSSSNKFCGESKDVSYGDEISGKEFSLCFLVDFPDHTSKVYACWPKAKVRGNVSLLEGCLRFIIF